MGLNLCRGVQIILIFSLLMIGSLKSEKAIPCPLVWVETWTGEPLPPDALSTSLNEDTHFIARFSPSTTSSVVIVGGRMSKSEGLAYGVYNGLTEMGNSFEVLSNPHNCKINWVKLRDANSNFWVTSSTESTTIIMGRVYLQDAALAGTISLDNIAVMWVVDGGLEPKQISSASYEILQSYSIGLNLKFSHFKFAQDPFKGSKEFLGMDEIYNLGSSTSVKQSVRHRKKVVEYSKFYAKSSMKHVSSVEATIQPEFKYDMGDPENNQSLPITIPSPIGLTLGYEMTTEEETTQEKTTYRETDVAVEREIEVPPLTSVQICSSLTMANDFSMPYTARAEYSAPGLSGQQIKDILEADEVTGVTIEGDICVKEEGGQLSGTLATLTQFIVVPMDSEDGGCASLSREIQQLKKSFGDPHVSQAERQKRFLQIEKSINRLVGKSN